MFPFTLYQLRILKAVAANKSFTKAAETLYLSQPSLSKQIKTLEKSLDLLLIDRKDKHTFLTKDGRVLLKYAERILALCEESCRALLDLKAGERGSLSIGANQIVGAYLFPKILILVAQKYPQTTINLKVYPIPVLIHKFELGSLDVLIIDEDVIEFFTPSSNLRVETFLYDKLNLVASRSHPLTKKAVIRKTEIYFLEYITLNPTCIVGLQLKKLLEQNQINTGRLKSILELDSVESIKVALILGLGVAFIPSLATRREIQLKLLKPILVQNSQIVQRFFLVRNMNCEKSQTFEFFFNTLLRLKKEVLI